PNVVRQKQYHIPLRVGPRHEHTLCPYQIYKTLSYPLQDPLSRIEAIKLPYEIGQLSLICRSDFLHPSLPLALIAIRSETGKVRSSASAKGLTNFPHLGE